MRVKLDENLAVQLKRLFTESGDNADSVVEEGLGDASGAMVAAAGMGDELVLVRQDLGFLRHTDEPACGALRYQRIQAIYGGARCSL